MKLRNIIELRKTQNILPKIHYFDMTLQTRKKYERFFHRNNEVIKRKKHFDSFRYTVESSLIHWNENVIILTKFSSLAEMKVVKMTTFSASDDKKNYQNDKFPFQCLGVLPWWHFDYQDRLYQWWSRPTVPNIHSTDSCTRAYFLYIVSDHVTKALANQRRHNPCSQDQRQYMENGPSSTQHCPHILQCNICPDI